MSLNYNTIIIVIKKTYIQKIHVLLKQRLFLDSLSYKTGYEGLLHWYKKKTSDVMQPVIFE